MSLYPRMTANGHVDATQSSISEIGVSDEDSSEYPFDGSCQSSSSVGYYQQCPHQSQIMLEQHWGSGAQYFLPTVGQNNFNVNANSSGQFSNNPGYYHAVYYQDH